MNKKKTISVIVFMVSMFPGGYAQESGTKKFVYKQKTQQLYQMFTKQQIEKAKQSRMEMDSVIYNGPYKANYASLSLHQTPEWFRDAKFGIAVNYGIYSVAGAGEQGYGGNYYTDTYTNTMYNTMRSYHIANWGADFERDDFIPLFSAKYMDAETYLEIFKRAGARYFALFLNHRSTGMLLWDSDYTFRDSKDMPPHRDLAGEFVKACRRNGMPFCAYFNLEDTDYPIVNPVNDELYVREWTPIRLKQPADHNTYEVMHKYNPQEEERRLQGKIPVYDYVDDYLLPVSKELIDKYEPDYIWFDGGWKRPAWYYKSQKITAYYYNKFEGSKDVLVNCRLGNDLYGKLGDVIISEGGSSDEGEPTNYWEEISPMGRNFAYDKWETDANIPSSADLIRMLIRIVAGGGNFFLIVAPDGQGKIPEYQVKRLDDIGRWLEINGEAIYNTVTHPFYSEEDKFGHITYYTRSKDHRYTYALTFKLGSNRLILFKGIAKAGTDVQLLGYDKNLEWFNSDWGLNILLSEDVLNNLPCSHAWVFRFEEGIPDSGTKLQVE